MIKKLKWYEISFMYMGIVMGAGFASGRECWQFFGVFGSKGYYGAIAVTLGFICISYMLCTIAKLKNTIDLGELISPFNNKKISSIFGYIMAGIYYTIIMPMTAAGGSLLNQQFDIHKAIGGALIAAFVIITVLGDFERLSKVFRILVPFLIVVAMITIITVIKSDFSQSGPTTGYKPSRISPNWIISAIVYLAYNSLAMITMAGSSTLNAKNTKHAYIGAVSGSVALGILIISLLRAMLSDMAFSSSLDLPMLGYSARISNILNVLYAIILYGSIYSAAASTYYGFSTKIPKNKYKEFVIIAGVIIGYILGLTGFKKLVEILYPLHGYIGIVFIILITINFFKVRKINKQNIGVDQTIA